MYTERQLILAAQVLIYLRKSRSDDANETVAEVLAKHESELQEYAVRELGGPVPENNIYREVISAESIDAREEFKKVLARLEDPEIRAVLVVDPQRLSRGDLGDCHKLITTFALTKKRILTTRKGDFNLSNDRERKFFQDELLRGRDYYDYVRNTLWAGRVRAAKRGCFIGNCAPYGYKKIQIGKDHTLEIIEDQAEIVRLIFKLYTDDGLTPHFIAVRLNEMGVKAPRGDKWLKDTVRKIVGNEHYAGRVVFNRINATPVLENGEVIKKLKLQPDEEIIVAEGKHDAIIDQETWEKASNRIAGNPRLNTGKPQKNTLAGIIKCSKCGLAMYVHPYKNAADRYECRTKPRCFKSVPMEDVHAAVLYSLENVQLPDLEDRVRNDDGNALKIQRKLIEKLEKEMQDLRDREDEQYDLLEARVYDRPTFERRNAKLREKIEEVQTALYKAKSTLPESVDFAERIVTLKTAIAAMKDQSLTPAEQNRLLRAIVERIEYTGVEAIDHTRRKGLKRIPNNFTLEITLRL